MSCPTHTELSAYGRKVLTGRDKQRVKDHIRGCAVCRAIVNDLDPRQEPLLLPTNDEDLSDVPTYDESDED